jgi:hypothetical protein
VQLSSHLQVHHIVQWTSGTSAGSHGATMIATMPRAWSKLCITRILSGSSYQHDLYQNRSSHLSPNALKRGFHTSCLQICPTLTIRCYEPKLQSQRHRRFHVASLDLDNLDPLLIWDTRKLRSKRPGRRKAGSTHVGSIRCCLTTTLEEGRGVHQVRWET